MASEKTRNGGKWTEARFRAFIMTALRSASVRWNPRAEALRLARLERGLYLCAMCNEKVPATNPPPEGKTRRVKNVAADHIDPVIDPETGFVDWNTVIERMFCEVKGFQVLCNRCHDIVTKDEKDRALKRKRHEKENNERD